MLIIMIISIITLEGTFNSMCTFVLIDDATNQTISKSMSWPSRILVNFFLFSYVTIGIKYLKKRLIPSKITSTVNSENSGLK